MRFQKIDLELTKALYKLSLISKPLTQLGKLSTRIFAIPLLTTITLLSGISVSYTIKLILATLIIGIIIEFGVKKIFKRDRPEFSKLYKKTYSFPSSHSLVTGAWMTLVILGDFNLILDVSILFTGFYICLSRSVFGHHYISDILGGLIGGILIGSILSVVL